MLLKSVYQWDIDSADDLAKFREDSGQIDQQVERVIYRRSDNIAPGEFVKTPQMQSPARKREKRSMPRNQGRYNTAVPYMSREKFLEQVSTDLSEDFPFEEDMYYRVYDGHDSHTAHGRDIPHRIVVRAVIEHRDGKPIRAEFLEVRGESLAELPNPNAGGIRDCHGDGNGRAGYIVEDETGEMRMDEELFLQIKKREGSSDEEAGMVIDTVERLTRKDLDDSEDLLKEYLMKEIIGIE